MAALLAVAALAATGCSGGDPEPEPLVIDGEPSTPSPSESPSATGTGSPSPTPDGQTAFDDKGHEVVAGHVEARGAEEQEVVDAWLAYWQVRLDAFHAAQVDAARLGEVATGKAASEVVGYADFLSRKQLSTVGDMRMGVDRVRVRGDRATLRSCVENKTVDRDAAGKAAEQLSPFFVFRGELVRSGDGWRVGELSIDSRTPC